MTTKGWLTALKFCASITLIARGWLTWRWDSPFRGIIWKEDWWGGMVDDWATFATTSDPAITNGLMILGCVMMVGGVVPWLLPYFPKLRWALLFFAGLLVLDSAARWINTHFDLGMAIEHALQMVAPVALFLAVSFPDKTRPWILMVSVATAFTFVGHGLYAMGFHPVPLSYQTMTMNILSVSQESAFLILKIAGWLDVLAAACLFVRPLRFYALLYMIAWGAATALARIVAHGNIDPWLWETAVRTSHWMLPLLLLLLTKRVESKS